MSNNILGLKIIDAEYVEGELGERTKDDSIAHFKTSSGQQLPNGALFDVTRMQMLLAQYRERHKADTATVGLIEDGNGRPHLALWPDDDPNRAVILAPVEKPGREVEA